MRLTERGRVVIAATLTILFLVLVAMIDNPPIYP
jgi:hypothetical protein